MAPQQGSLHLLNAKDRVVLRDTLTAGRSTSLDLANTERDDKVRDQRVLRLARPVRHHDTPAVRLRALRGLDRLGDRANLVDLREESEIIEARRIRETDLEQETV